MKYLLVLGLCWSALAGAASWDGPVRGPSRQGGKSITFISHDARNGGISTAYLSFATAARQLGWRLNFVNAQSDPRRIRAAFMAAIASHEDAIVVGGFEAREFNDVTAQARKARIVLAGWHASAEPGPVRDLFVNISTDPVTVANMAVEAAINSARGPMNAVIFNDPRFGIANAKTRQMKEAIAHCRTCKLLSIENVFITNAAKEVPAAVARLNRSYGASWTHTLAINDIYFDYMNLPLTRIGRRDIRNISAGDGSNTALARIYTGSSQQVATVAEPMGVQGWQLADELNRAFAGRPPSGYVAKPILVTTRLLRDLRSIEIDADIPYREAYLAIWRGEAGEP